VTAEQKQIMEKFVEVFQGEGSAYGTEEGGCIRKPVTWEVIYDHLYGSAPIGVYPMHDNQVKWGCVDYDEGDEESFQKGRRLGEALSAIGVPAFMEKSRSKGWHVWVFAASAVPAATMRRALLVACKVANAESKEINPKAETLPPGSLGNYVRLPYPNGYDTAGEGRRCIWRDFSVDWLPIDLPSFLDQVVWASPSQLQYAADLYREPPRSAASGTGEFHGETEELTDAQIRALPGLAFTIWKDGPLPDNDRSGTLLRFAALLQQHGFTIGEARQYVASADRRWGKYLNRTVPAWHEIDKIIERVYA
jgi:hypothetical protein